MGMIGLLCGAIFSLALGLATVGVSRILIVWMLEEMQAEWREIQWLRIRLAEASSRGER